MHNADTKRERVKHLFLAQRKESDEEPCGCGSIPVCSPANREPEHDMRSFQQVLDTALGVLFVAELLHILL